MIKFTPIKKTSSDWNTRHPWLRDSKTYAESLRLKKLALIFLTANADEPNKRIYQEACRANFIAYDDARRLLMDKALDNTKGSTREFYSVMKTGNKRKKCLPDLMTYNQVYVKDRFKLEKIAQHLGSNFLNNVPDLGNSNLEIDEKFHLN